MSRFQLSLRDVLIIVTVLCVQLALFAAYFQLTERHQQLVVGGFYLFAAIVAPVLLAIGMADVKRRLPLLSGIAGFLVVFMMWSQLQYSPLDSFVARLMTNHETFDMPAFGFVGLNVGLFMALPCAWITRSLLPPSTDSPR